MGRGLAGGCARRAGGCLLPLTPTPLPCVSVRNEKKKDNERRKELVCVVVGLKTENT